MAFKYRQITPQSGDLINPDDWNVNVREYTNEFNGHLDRDNLPEKGITSASIKANSFHQVHSDASGEFVILEKDQSRFKQIQIIEFETQHQGIVTCEWSGYWIFETIQANLQSTSNIQKLDYRMLVNGTEVSRISTETNLRKMGSGYMVGALPVEAGIVRVTIEAKTTKATFVVNLDNVEYPAEGFVQIENRELIAVLKVA
tara:strand:- start:2650 stop:3252 length:603 start_codon:yes stop_codon:yes gene_type:complete